jgi:hypothetical protein
MNNMSKLVLLLLWLPLVASAIPRAINPVDVMVVESGSVQPKLWSIDSLTSDSVTHADHADTADVAFKALLTTHGVTSGTVPKAATDSTFTNSHISENGDTTKISVSGYADTMVWYDVGSRFNNTALESVAYGGGMFVATGKPYGGYEIVSSSDGINWTGRNGPASFTKNSVDYCNNRFVITGGGYWYFWCNFDYWNYVG